MHHVRHFLLVVLLALPASVQAQVCLVDTQYATPGIYPDDTLPIIDYWGPSINVLQLVFPVDTVVFGMQIPFDSFRVGVSGLPPEFQYECNHFFNACHYVADPGLRTRGCLKVTALPNPTYQGPFDPMYGSFQVDVTGYLTVFSNSMQLPMPKTVHFLVRHPGDSLVGLSPESALQWAVHQVIGETRVNFALQSPGHVRLAAFNLVGEQVAGMTLGDLPSGPHTYVIPLAGLADGVYLLRFDLDHSRYVTQKKFVVIH